jgi:hypothetical protein
MHPHGGSATYRVAVAPHVQHKAPQQLWVQAACQLTLPQRLQAGGQLGVVHHLAAQQVTLSLQAVRVCVCGEGSKGGGGHNTKHEVDLVKDG